jgi:hypothetical protein
MAGLGALLMGALLQAAPARIWVSPQGSDESSGTQEAPFRSLERALREAREWRRLEAPKIAEGIRIEVGAGTYRLDAPLQIRWEDAGTAESPTVFAAAEGEMPVISGGVSVSGWSVADAVEGLSAEALGHVWMADAPRMAGRPIAFRDFWVNGQRAQRAWNVRDDQFPRLLDWDKGAQVGWIPAAAVDGLGEPEGLEMVVHQMWAIAILRVKSIEVVGDRAKVTFHEPENRVQFEHPWPPVVISEDHGNSIFYLSNRLEFLDEPGEWYQDPVSGKIYYWPREEETPETVEAIVPKLETLVQIEGRANRPVDHVEFEGIQFSHTTWMRPSEAGHVPLQAGFYMYEAYKLKEPGTPDKAALENQAWVGRKPAAVEVRFGREIDFRHCRFENLAASGLDYEIGTKGGVVEGNLFRDIGGSGFVMGAFQEEGVETHVPYLPEDERVICQGLSFTNNLLTDIANIDWGCVGVLIGYARHNLVAHNEISHVAYTGISLGWGWTQTESPALRGNTIRSNHIHEYAQRVYDTAGIYTLSSQPETVIEGNSIHSIARPDFVHDPYHWAYIYLDEASSHIRVQNNWTEGIKFTTNNTGPNNVWLNTGPDAVEVKESAGLQPAFHHLLDSFGDRDAP